MEEEEEEEEIAMDADADDGGAIVDTSSSRDGLLVTLLRLGVCLPSPSPSTKLGGVCLPSTSLFVLRKKLLRSYLIRNQNYLGITHAEYAAGFRRQGECVLTDGEHDRAHAKGAGLPLRALDRRGVSYRMVLVHLAKTCRLRTGWGEFLRRSGVRQDDDDDDDANVGDVVEIWAFRSPAWSTGLGLVLLHYTKEEDADIMASSSLQQVEEEEEEEEEEDDDDDDDSSSITTSLCSNQEAVCVEEEDPEVEQAAATLISMK